MSKSKNNKTFELETYALYPVKIRVKASSKSEAIKILEDKDKWNDVETEHNVSEWRFDNFYVEDIKEVKSKVNKNKEALNKSELHNVFKDKEGLD